MSRKDVCFQKSQAVFHAVMAVVLASTVSFKTLEDPLETFKSTMLTGEKKSDDWGVSLCYTMAMTYNVVLYFQDPLSRTKLKARHLASTLMGTVFFLNQELFWCVLVVLGCVMWDGWDFYWDHMPNLKPEDVVISVMIMVHHSVTVSLLALSWLHHQAFGVSVLFIHDLTDVSMFVVRIVRKLNYRMAVQAFPAVVTMVMWLYYRVFYFGLIIWNVGNAIVNDPETIELVELVKNLGLYEGTLVSVLGMVILWIFNAYWTGLLFSKVVKELVFQQEQCLNHE